MSPILPSQSSNSSGRIESPGENTGYIVDIIDQTPGTTYDAVLDFVFGFYDVPPEWTRKMRLYIKFDRDAKGEVDPDCKDLRKLYRIFQQMGYTKIRDGILKGIGVNAKGKFVDENDKPIKDIAGLLKAISEDKSFLIYLAKDKNGYDKVVSVLDLELDKEKKSSTYAEEMRESYDYWVNQYTNNPKLSTAKTAGYNTDKEEEDLIYVPGEN